MIRKSRLRSWLLAGSILVLAGLLGATTAVAAQETIRPTNRQEAEQRQEQIEEERQEVNNRIAYISGQQLEILQGRNEARQVFEEQQAKIQAVRQARNASSLRHLQLQEDIAAFQTQLDELNRVKTDIVVQRYLQDRTDPVEISFLQCGCGEGLSLAALDRNFVQQRSRCGRASKGRERRFAFGSARVGAAAGRNGRLGS